MEESPLAFVSNRHHPSEGALTSIGGGGGGVVLLSPTCPLLKPESGAANNGILDYLQPSSPVSALHNNPTSALSLSTYTAGEDAGRLAMLAKELGLARTRPPKRQIRKHSFKVNPFVVFRLGAMFSTSGADSHLSLSTVFTVHIVC